MFQASLRQIAFLVVLILCVLVGAGHAEDQNVRELEKIRVAGAAARQAAAANPTITNATSPPVLVYLAEQQRRRLTTTISLRQRIQQLDADQTQASLVTILKQQLRDLESKPLDKVGYDSAYGYQPTTGLVGYSKKVRLLENRPDGQSVILVDSTALVIAGLGTSQYASGKFFSVDKAILIGAQGMDYMFQGSNKKTFAATLVDLESLLISAPRKLP